MARSETAKYYDRNPQAKKKKKAYDTAYQSTTSQKKRRAARNASRRKLEALGRVRKGDGKDVHHIDGNPKNKSNKNLRVESASRNRGRK